jgi:hypothetical protein
VGERTFEGIAFEDVVCNGSAVVDSHVPMFDSDVFVILLDIREDCDIAYNQKGSRYMHTRGVDVLDALDLKVFIDFNASVLFKLDLGFF